VYVIALVAEPGVEVHQPLVPEGTCLLERWDRERPSGLIGKCQGDNRTDALRRDRCQRVRRARAPVVSHHRDTIELEDIQQIDRIPSKRDPASIAPDPRSAGTIVRQPR
jgi:hypothetical protein